MRQEVQINRESGSASPATDSVKIEECPGGPLLVRGAKRVEVDGYSRDVERPVVAVCRCGGSALFPWCDSTHKRLAARERG